MIFETITKNAMLKTEKNSRAISFSGISIEQWALNFASSQNISGTHTFVLPSNDACEELYGNFKKYGPQHYQYLLLLGLENSPYGGYLSSERDFIKRLGSLSHLFQEKQKTTFVFTTLEALAFKIPNKEFFKKTQLEIEVSDILSPYELASSLQELGYFRSTTVEEPGTFSIRGEIADIYPVGGKPFRLHYFDDMIEEIYLIDLDTQRTLKESPLEKVNVAFSTGKLASGDLVSNLRKNIPMPQTSQKDRFRRRSQLFELLGNGQLFENYPAYFPLFFESTSHILKELQNDSQSNTLYLLEGFKCKHNLTEYFERILEDYHHDLEDPLSENLLSEPSKIYELDFLNELQAFSPVETNSIDFSVDFSDEDITNKVEVKIEDYQHFIADKVNPSLSRPQFIKESLLYIDKNISKETSLVFAHTHESSKKEFLFLLQTFGLNQLEKKIRFINFPLEKGFYYSNEKILVISEADLFSVKKEKIKKSKQHDLDLFAEQMASLKAGDFVIHSTHGTGRYLGLETLEIGSDKSDFLVLEYTGRDKVYVPVYKLNLIQKHADKESTVHVDSLRSNKFHQLKKKASQAVKKLAFDLLKLQAERETADAFAFSSPDKDYRDFELAFPFQDTPDQASATEHVLEEMQKKKPMDYLVCGDVGFGKTEIAMRAAFKAVLDQKQVAVLVPTTILALQHFNSFQKRFKNFPVNIEFISRFKTPKETKEILEKLQKGEVDIIIGTHKLLAKNVHFHDLGLVVVDEEQRFGVSHKEKLKLLKASVDFLTLTATPIPRTLQLSFLGLRDISLIRTAPPKRQSIKSYIIKEDELTIQSAIRKEINRGGQVFIVHNRVQDIEEYSGKIRELVPEAKIVIGHGQLPEKELEKRIRAFYNGEFQVLIATTIIESGIDIPNANTMIIDRADRYGLSQLHQLRGRIGRSDKKAYAYFVIPKYRKLTPVAERRLKALQTYADMGSGFNIASADLEIRGAGDILGAQQSGHIEAIGLELYMDLLQDAIRELKGEKKVINRDIEIKTPFPSYIPNQFIEDSGERLKVYKRLSNAKSLETIEQIEAELSDMYGAFPEELKNLFVTLRARVALLHTGIKTVQLVERSLSLQFDSDLLSRNPELSASVANYFLSKPKVYQFSPDNKVLYKHHQKIDQEEFIHLCKQIAEHIVP